MNDPHVVALLYTIEHGPSVDYREAEPQDYEEKHFSVRIEDEQVCFTMKAHYATEEKAREAVREYIERWEFKVCLQQGPNRFKLEFERSQREDRSPRPAPKVPPGTLSITGIRVRAGRATGRVGKIVVEKKDKRSPYPSPARGLKITPDVESMQERLRDYRKDGKELGSRTNFCLTVLQDAGGGRKAVAKKYGIAFEVLSKIGSLCNNKGASQARKNTGAKNPFTPSETRFLEEAMVVLIRRAAEVAYDPHKSRDTIKLSDLPDLV